MNILLTGSAGRVGRAIYVALMQQHRVMGVDTTPSSTTDVIADIRDQATMHGMLQGIDAVVHVAALHAPHVGLRSDQDFNAINVLATEDLMKACLQQGVKHLVFTSTTAVFGHASQAEQTSAWVTENTQPEPKTIYHHSKLAAERALQGLSIQSGLPVTVLRVSRCFPEPADLMSVYRLNRGVDARDVANAHLKAVELRPEGYQQLIISGQTPFNPADCDDLYNHCDQLIKRKQPGLAAEFANRGWQLPTSLDRVYDSSAAQQVLGWQAEHGYQSVLQMLDMNLFEVLPVVSP